jgi:hypothetical protein
VNAIRQETSITHSIPFLPAVPRYLLIWRPPFGGDDNALAIDSAAGRFGCDQGMGRAHTRVILPVRVSSGSRTDIRTSSLGRDVATRGGEGFLWGKGRRNDQAAGGGSLGLPLGLVGKVLRVSFHTPLTQPRRYLLSHRLTDRHAFWLPVSSRLSQGPPFGLSLLAVPGVKTWESTRAQPHRDEGIE